MMTVMFCFQIDIQQSLFYELLINFGFIIVFSSLDFDFKQFKQQFRNLKT